MIHYFKRNLVLFKKKLLYYILIHKLPSPFVQSGMYSKEYMIRYATLYFTNRQNKFYYRLRLQRLESQVIIRQGKCYKTSLIKLNFWGAFLLDHGCIAKILKYLTLRNIESTFSLTYLVSSCALIFILGYCYYKMKLLMTWPFKTWPKQEHELLMPWLIKSVLN